MGYRKIGHDRLKLAGPYSQPTTTGRKQLAVEVSQFERVIGAVTPVVEAV
jgi:hypothetical protein